MINLEIQKFGYRDLFRKNAYILVDRLIYELPRPIRGQRLQYDLCLVFIDWSIIELGHNMRKIHKTKEHQILTCRL